MSLGANIKKYRTQNQLKQEDIAKALGVTRSTVSCYESNKTTPPLKVIEKLTKLFCLPSPDYLLMDNPSDILSFSSPGSRYNNQGRDDSMVSSVTWGFGELSDDEKAVVLNFRLLSQEDQQQIHALLEKLKENSYLE